METMAKWIRHNQGLFVALILTGGLLFWAYGCESEVASLAMPGKMVTAAELDIEVRTESARLEAQLKNLLEMAELRKEELFRQDGIKRKVFEFAALTAQAGTFNPAGLITLAGSLLGVGVLMDNRIKDKVIKNRPLKET